MSDLGHTLLDTAAGDADPIPLRTGSDAFPAAVHRVDDDPEEGSGGLVPEDHGPGGQR